MSSDRLPFVLLRFSAVPAALLALTAGATGQSPAPPSADVTFARDIAPILQRSCQECHHPDGAGPMSLVTYEDARPWARAMKTRTALRSQRGAMPPFFVERNIGIQRFKHDPSLSEEEIATIAKWADSGAARGNPADMPPLRRFDSTASNTSSSGASGDTTMGHGGPTNSLIGWSFDATASSSSETSSSRRPSAETTSTASMSAR